MSRRTGILILLAVLVALATRGLVRTGVAAPPQQPAASAADIRALVERTIANQHRNDAVIYEYERVERRYQRDGPRVTEDKTYRVVPTGTGTLKLLVKDGIRSVDLAFYQKQLRDWEGILNVALNPNDPREKQSEEKMRKRERERAELVDDTREAYRFTWLGHETRQGRTLVKLAADPNPGFHPRSRSAELLTHARATVWIDEEAGQLVRAEAEITRDISFGGGFLGKIYHGGRFVMEQAEVVPGIWLPTLYQYDFQGRKFLFGFDVHETTEISRYRHVGPPREILALVRGELATGRGFAGDP